MRVLLSVDGQNSPDVEDLTRMFHGVFCELHYVADGLLMGFVIVPAYENKVFVARIPVKAGVRANTYEETTVSLTITHVFHND